ncbi:MAG: hypothetical protein ACTSSB_14750, partial [Candidatus Heimdallarchaeota archaeon]
MPIQLAQSATNVGTLDSSQATQPTIDGNITAAEWSQAQELIVTLYHQTFPSTISMNITIMSTYDVAAETISFALIIPDTTKNMGDGVYLLFKTNAAEELFILDPSFDFGAGHDLKA